MWQDGFSWDFLDWINNTQAVYIIFVIRKAQSSPACGVDVRTLFFSFNTGTAFRSDSIFLQTAVWFIGNSNFNKTRCYCRLLIGFAEMFLIFQSKLQLDIFTAHLAFQDRKQLVDFGGGKRLSIALRIILNINSIKTDDSAFSVLLFSAA